MSSRSQQKADARRVREAHEAEARRATQRRRALIRLAVIAAASFALVAGAVVITRSGGEDSASALERRGQVASRFAGLPQEGITLGNPDAPATLIEFADLQCPYCAVYGRDVLPAVLDRYVRPGRLRLELHVLTFLGEDSVRAGRMAGAAALQNRLWNFADAFYRDQGAENSGYVTDEFLRTVGEAAGLDVAAALRARDEPAAERMLTAAQAAADERSVQSTPSFYLRRGNGRPQQIEPDDLTPDGFAAALDKALGDR